MTEVRIVTKFASACASVPSFFRPMPMMMTMQRGCFAFLLLVLLSFSIHYTVAQACLPKLNDGGVLEFWDMVPGRKLVAVVVVCASLCYSRWRV